MVCVWDLYPISTLVSWFLLYTLWRFGIIRVRVLLVCRQNLWRFRRFNLIFLWFAFSPQVKINIEISLRYISLIIQSQLHLLFTLYEILYTNSNFTKVIIGQQVFVVGSKFQTLIIFDAIYLEKLIPFGFFSCVFRYLSYKILILILNLYIGTLFAPGALVSQKSSWNYLETYLLFWHFRKN